MKKKYEFYRVIQKTGKNTKKPIVTIEAENELEARKVFGINGWWEGYSENTCFDCVEKIQEK